MNTKSRIQAIAIATFAASSAWAQTATPWKMLVWVPTRATVVSTTDGVRQDRYFLNEPEMDRIRETLDLFEKAAEAESGGKLDVQIEMKTDAVPFYRLPGQTSDPLVRSIGSRFNEAAFDSDDKTPRGPYSGVLVVDPQPGAWAEGSPLRKMYPCVSRRFGTSVGFVSLLATNGGSGASALLQDFLAVWRAEVALRTGFDQRWAPSPEFWSSVPAPGAVVRAKPTLDHPLGVFSPIQEPGKGIFGEIEKTDSDNGPSLKLPVSAGVREGEVELMDGLDVDLSATPILEFWLQSTVQDPVELRIGDSAKLAIGYYPGAKLWVNPAPGGGWQKFRIDLKEFAKARVSQVVLGIPEETRRLETAQLGNRAISIAGLHFIAADAQPVDNPVGMPAEATLIRQLSESSPSDAAGSLSSDSIPVRVAALYRLAFGPNAPEEAAQKRLAELSKNSEPLVSIFAIKAMARIPGADTAKALQYCLEVGPFEHCRMAAAEAMADVATAESAPLLATMLTAREWRSRVAGIAGLAKFPTRETTIILLAMLPDPEPEVRRTICEGVDLSMDLANRRLLFVAVNDAVESVRIAAYRRLLADGMEEFKSEAMKGVREESPYVRTEVLRAMTVKPIPAFRRYVLLGLGDRDPRVRLEALSALAKQPGPPKKEEIESVLNDPDDEVKAAARAFAQARGL